MIIKAMSLKKEPNEHLISQSSFNQKVKNSIP